MKPYIDIRIILFRVFRLIKISTWVEDYSRTSRINFLKVALIESCPDKIPRFPNIGIPEGQKTCVCPKKPPNPVGLNVLKSVHATRKILVDDV